MKEYEIYQVAGHDLEYFDLTHEYLVDGIKVPSVTQMLKHKFGGKYGGVNDATLARAAEAGTEVHEAIEEYCATGFERDLPEVHNFRFLERQYRFMVTDIEVPLILFDGTEPIAAGRCDLVMEMDGMVGGADIKRTAALDRDYLAHQLNLYRIAYRQSYGVEWQFLRGVHLRGEETRKSVEIPINEDATWAYINDWRVHHGEHGEA